MTLTSTSTASRSARVSRWALAGIPVTFVAGVVLLLVLIGDPNVPTAPQRWDNAWRVTLAWAVMMVPPVVGAVAGLRAVKEGERSVRVVVALHVIAMLIFTGLTLLGGVLDGF